MGAVPKLPWWLPPIARVLLPVEALVIEPLRRLCGRCG